MQRDLFAAAPRTVTPTADLPLLPEQLKHWQLLLHAHQAPLFRGETTPDSQTDLFNATAPDTTAAIDPLAFTPLPMSFWRWPDCPHQGAAIYLVMDRPDHLEQPLLLYVGETLSANRRWKGDHDCKGYLSAYGEALQQAGMSHQLSIRFCTDVPKATRARRSLEQKLIQRWLPPFNKETRRRWATPFTTDH